jgi:hypothetical protein
MAQILDGVAGERILSMKDINVKWIILHNLYKVYFLADGTENLSKLREKENWDSTTFWNVANRMSHDGLIKAWAAGG